MIATGAIIDLYAAMGEHDHNHDGDDHGHDHGHHGHGHAKDQGISGMLRYLRWAPRMWRSEINDAVVDLVAPLEGETVVDIGAGMGPATVKAARLGALVVAVEPTPFMRRLVSARRLFQRARGNISVVDGGAEHLPLADASADAVWAVNTMHHWVDPSQGAAEIARVLRPGGRIVLVDENFGDPDHPEFERWGAAHGDDGDAGHHGFSMVDATEVGDLLSSAGLIDVEAGHRNLAARPVIAITARLPGPG